MKCTDLRLPSAFQSILDDIPGIGEKRRKMLLKHFGSVKKLKEATVEEIIALGIPKAVANELISNLQD